MTIKEIVRNLRKNQTKSEALVWHAVRNRKLKTKKFVRQYPIQFEMDNRKRFFVADFYCHEKRLVVEIDGKIHERQKDYDEMRTNIIEILNMTVIRFKNEEVENHFDSVIEKIETYL